MMFTGCSADKTPCHTFYLPSNTSFCVKESSNMMLKNLTFRDGEGGVAAFNVYGSFAIENSLFVNNTEGIALSLYCSNQSDLCSQCYSAGEQLTVVISNSQFFDNHCSFACNGMSHAIHIRMGQWPPSVIHLENLTIANNIHGFHACGMSIYSDSAVLHTVVKGVLYTNNHMIGKLQYLEDAFILGVDSDESYIAIVDSVFINNDFTANTQAFDNEDSSVISILYFTARNVMISISNTSISNNTGWYGATLLAEYGHRSSFLLDNSIIANNSFHVFYYYKQGAVQLNSINNVTVHNCSFVNNSATGLLLDNSNVYFSGDNIIRGNRGYNGGGVALYYGSLTLSENATISFEDNLAENNGGGLYVKEVAYSNDLDLCFINTCKKASTLIYFSNNSAKTAGNDWYGGDLYCVMYMVDRQYYGWEVISNITD